MKQRLHLSLLYYFPVSVSDDHEELKLDFCQFKPVGYVSKNEKRKSIPHNDITSF